MTALSSSSDLQITPMPTKCGGVQVNQTMTLMTSVLLVIEWMWQINTESIAKALIAKATILCNDPSYL
jgi:hypothetical protein